MIATLVTVLLLVLPQGAPATLPDTPQGKHVQAFLDAFNTGDEKKYLAMQEQHLQPDLLKRRGVDERVQLFKRMLGDFGTLKIAKISKASAQSIEALIPNKEGIEATFTFTFEAERPYRISSLSVEIDRGGN